MHPCLFTLDVTTEPSARRAILRLAQHGGSFIAAHEVELAAHPASRWHGLFDTRRHVRSLERVTPAAEQLAVLGAFLGEHVLGPEMARALAAGVESRTLLVRLPADPTDALAAAFARVPWEIARAPGDDRTLGDRNLVVRVAMAGAEPSLTQPSLGKDPARVLLVFAETPGQRPLAARLERERLLDLFFREVLPGHDVEIDVLCHGVTRAKIRDQVRARGGYHVVHWSGHGHADTLEIALDEGERAAPWISGGEFAGIFAEAGGFIPLVVFLSAHHSGGMIAVKDWESLRASLREGGCVKEGEPGLDGVLKSQPGFAGTALSLVRAGVKQVVAMRYEVGDAYARRLALGVYRGMFAELAHHTVDVALALARGELARDQKRAGEYGAVDHVTPLVFGSGGARIVPAKRRSAQMDRREPRPQPLLAGKDLDRPRDFVGRGEELTRLQRDWLDARQQPIALIQGLAGLGKTSLAAEAVHLWFDRFDSVLAFQAKGAPLSVEGMLQRIDQRLVIASKSYRERCAENELARVYILPGTDGLRGAEREELLCNNLIDTFRSERVLLVLDNFETNLLTTNRCKDPAWDRLFEALADRLSGTGSRLLVTSRHRPAAMENNAVWLPLGPLPMLEAALFFQAHAPLKELWYGDDAAKALAQRILYVSRGHPLILHRIANLARAKHDKPQGLSPAGRQIIVEALDKIQGVGYKALPDVFAGARGDKDREQERSYLEDVAAGAVDLLIERLSLDARTLLWIVTRAGEPVTEDMISAVWGGAPAALLGEMCGAGLLTADGDAYSFHELAAERAKKWMDRNPVERGGRTEAEIWKAYGEWHGAAFNALLDSGKREMAQEAGRRSTRYLVAARAFDSLSAFASKIVTSVRDPSLVGAGIPTGDLQVRIDDVIEQAHAEAAGLQNLVARWPIWSWLQDTLRATGLAPASARELPTPGAPSAWAIFANPSEQLQQHFELAEQILVLCAPESPILPGDITRVEKILDTEPRVDPGFVLVLTAEPDADTRLAPTLPDDRRYLFVQAETLRTAADPKAFLHTLLRDALGHRRLFDFRLPAGEWQFFGRERELESLERDALRGQCLGVFGLRKVGKSSLLRRLAQKLRRSGARRVVPVEVDLQDTPFSRRNLAGVVEHIGRALDREIRQAKIDVSALPAEPMERLRGVVERVEETQRGRILLILDEYEVLLGGRIPVRDGIDLLTWLRGLAQEHPSSFGFVLIGRNQKLLSPARIEGIDNPMYRFLRSVPVTGLVPEDCHRMVATLGGRMGLRFEQDALDLFVTETGGHPALARALGDLVDRRIATLDRPFTVRASTVNEAIPRFSRTVDEDMRELIHAADDFDTRAHDYLVHLAHGARWIGGPSEARIEDALVGYGILHPDSQAFRIGRLRAWLLENYECRPEAAHG